MNRVLEGVKVVDLTTYAAAPMAGRMLADFGAEVIKIEPLKAKKYYSSC
ncbi:MAG: CoA-transferase family [Firmicutes bacterium]|nr:CoA-transferase family [Bacillota bacterium]